MSEIIPLAGSWFWWIVAVLLLVGELMMPGFFMLWLAGAAALTGLADLVFQWSWRGEVACFAIVSILLVLASWRWVMASRHVASDQPHLNQRHQNYVGRVVPLTQAMVNGSGKVRIDDALWDVDGPDLPQGTLVKIIAVNGLRLQAHKA